MQHFPRHATIPACSPSQRLGSLSSLYSSQQRFSSCTRSANWSEKRGRQRNSRKRRKQPCYKTETPDGMCIPDELARREERLKKLAEARAKIEARAKERFEQEKAGCEANWRHAKPRRRRPARSLAAGRRIRRRQGQASRISEAQSPNAVPPSHRSGLIPHEAAAASQSHS